MGRLTLFFVLCFTRAFSQELVVNGDFENFIKCPDGYGNINDALGWNNLCESSDYFNSCVKEKDFLGVPFNRDGYQEANSGSGYAGLFLFTDNLSNLPGKEPKYIRKQAYYRREHIQTKLKSPLIKDRRYIVSAYVSLSDSSKFFTNKLSFGFSRNPKLVYEFPFTLLTIPPEYKVTYIGNKEFMDNNNWQKLELEYVAKGGELYLTIGLFKEDMSVKEFDKILGTNIFNKHGKSCYYLIDDVSVKLH